MDPQNHLLQHVTLVDLPGNGDRNKGRDQMWKQVISAHSFNRKRWCVYKTLVNNYHGISYAPQIVGNCSTVWIVSEINRAASEQESWEVLKRAGSLPGNGGKCQRIHFICTKCDHIDDLDDQ